MPRDLAAPAIVIAHGAWADATNWREVIAPVQAKGLRLVAVQSPLTALADDVAAVILESGPKGSANSRAR